MPSQRNIDQVKGLTEKLAGAKAVIFTDYSGLSVAEQQELRRSVAAAGGQFLVAKNTLFRLALRETMKGDLTRQVESALQGPTGFLFTYQDEIAPLRALVRFSQDHDLPKTKIGLILKPEDRVLTHEEVANLASLPSRDQLFTRLSSALRNPQVRLVRAISWDMGQLVAVLNLLHAKRLKGGEQHG